MLTIEPTPQKPASKLVEDYRQQRDAARAALKRELEEHAACRTKYFATKMALAEARQELELAAKMLLECGEALKNFAKPSGS